MAAARRRRRRRADRHRPGDLRVPARLAADAARHLCPPRRRAALRQPVQDWMDLPVQRSRLEHADHHRRHRLRPLSRRASGATSRQHRQPTTHRRRPAMGRVARDGRGIRPPRLRGRDATELAERHRPQHRAPCLRPRELPAEPDSSPASRAVARRRRAVGAHPARPSRQRRRHTAGRRTRCDTSVWAEWGDERVAIVGPQWAADGDLQLGASGWSSDGRTVTATWELGSPAQIAGLRDLRVEAWRSDPDVIGKLDARWNQPFAVAGVEREGATLSGTVVTTTEPGVSAWELFLTGVQEPTAVDTWLPAAAVATARSRAGLGLGGGSRPTDPGDPLARRASLVRR